MNNLLKEIKQYDAKAKQIIANNKNRIDKGLLPRMQDLLLNSMLASHIRTMAGTGHSDTLEFLNFLADTTRDADISSNFHTDTFIADFFPEIAQNKCLQDNLNMLFDLKQKGVGAGEVLFFLLFPLCKPSPVNTSDGVYRKLNIEMKSSTSSASIKANEDSRFEASIKAYNKYFKKNTDSNPELWENSTRSQWHGFFSELYPHFYNREVFDEIYEMDNTKKRKQAIGFLVLKEYKKIDDIGKLILLKPNKTKTDLEIVCVSDFNDREFITKNISFAPSVYRGKGTQAVGDGYADIRIMSKKASPGKTAFVEKLA